MPVVKARQAGAGLLDLLVAILVTSVGLLGLLAAQAAALRHARVSQYRAVATQLAQDITERIRANDAFGTVLKGYEVQLPFDKQQVPLAAPAKRCDVPTHACNPTEMARLDLYEWRTAVQALLPEGAVQVVPAAGADPRQADLWIAWRDPSLAGNPDQHRGGKECPPGLAVNNDMTVRCLFFRVGA